MVLGPMHLWKGPRRSEKKVDLSIKDLDENQMKTFGVAHLKNLVKL
jgi:hypothetical protein